MLRNLCCRHEYDFAYYYYTDAHCEQINVFICQKCGKRKKLHL